MKYVCKTEILWGCGWSRYGARAAYWCSGQELESANDGSPGTGPCYPWRDQKVSGE